jgi:POT family proton-dependent oligopeptide transporter
LGGFIADSLIGQRRSVYIGAILMAVGHFLMAAESLFFVALVFIIFGNGFFKPNISTQVGFLYDEKDKRRDSAFVIFYMGINLGALFSPLVCGTLGELVGWHWGFSAAGVGMLIGLMVYHFGRKYLPADGANFENQVGSTAHTRVQEEAALNAARFWGFTGREWLTIVALIVVCLTTTLFWSVFEQQGVTLQLWATDQTDWSLFGIQIPSTYYQAFNPAFILIFAPLLVGLWARQRIKGTEPSTLTKMAFGCLLLGIAFTVMIIAGKVVAPGEKGSVLWLASTTLIFTLGEIFLSPIGLSLITKASPRKAVSTMMGVWFLATALGNYGTGWIGSFYDLMSKDAFFTMLAVIGLALGCVFFIVKNVLERWIGAARV